jgi:hypothetical protein
MTDQKQNREGEVREGLATPVGAPAEPRRLREPLEIACEDGRRETVIVKRLSNTDMMKWIDLGFDKSFLVFRSVERAEDTGGRGSCRADQSWFDSLTQESAFAIVERALALNHSPIEKKVMAAVLDNLQSWLSLMPPSSSAPAATVSTS